MEEFKTLMQFLPNLNGKRVLQLGADEDLTKVLVEEDSILVSDKSLSEASESFDFVFLSSLLVNLNDEEVLQHVGQALKHLNLGGYLFFRESCIDSDYFFPIKKT